MDYAEASYFDGYAFKHIAEWFEQKRLERKRKSVVRMMDRRQFRLK